MAEKQYASTYYQLNKEKCIARQMEYHRKNRERYLEYMRGYNGLYWLHNKPEPRPKAPKAPKKVRTPRPPKEQKAPKPARVSKERPPKKEEWFVVREPVYPMKMERGNFVLEF